MPKKNKPSKARPLTGKMRKTSGQPDAVHLPSRIKQIKKRKDEQKKQLDQL